jgi:hypothetical protein
VIQQVNLYRDDVMLRAPQLDLRTLLRGLAALGGVLALISGALGVRDVLQGRALAALHVQLAGLESEVAALEARRAEQADTSALDARIAKLDAERLGKEQLIERIRSSSENRTGFSPHLEGLAHGRVPGMWLDSFEFTHGGRGLGLRGRALYADRVLGFMLELGAHGPYAGKEFEALELSRPDPGEALAFQLHTVDPDAGKRARERRP